jgi:acyl-CoA thioesterase
VGNLADDTAVDGGRGEYHARVTDDWSIWGPNGGYVASFALRAALAESRFDRPVSITSSFLSGARAGAATLTVSVLRTAKRAEALRVVMVQRDQPVLDAHVWTMAPSDGLAHDHAPAPPVPGPSELPLVEELVPDPPATRFSFFTNLQERPTTWVADWETRPPGEPRFASWFRFVPRPTFDATDVEAARLLIMTDVGEWPAAVRAHRPPVPWIAPTLSLAVRFHAFDATSEWLLSESVAPIAHDGLIGAGAAVWSEDRRLLATSVQQMLCRPV